MPRTTLLPAATLLLAAACSDSTSAPTALRDTPRATALGTGDAIAIVSADTDHDSVKVTVHLEKDGMPYTGAAKVRFGATGRPNVDVQNGAPDDRDPRASYVAAVLPKGTYDGTLPPKYKACGLQTPSPTQILMGNGEVWGCVTQYLESYAVMDSVMPGYLFVKERPRMDVHIATPQPGNVSLPGAKLEFTGPNGFRTITADGGAGDLDGLLNGHIRVLLGTPGLYGFCEVIPPTGRPYSLQPKCGSATAQWNETRWTKLEYAGPQYVPVP
jgi:hypothetical protein